MNRVMSVVPTLALVCACSSQASLEPANLTFLASVSPVVSYPTMFKITGSIRNDGSNTAVLHLGPCGAIGFRAYASPPPVTRPVFEFNPRAAHICTLELRIIELKPGETYPISAVLSADGPVPPGVYLVTVSFDYNGIVKEVDAGTMAIR
jgi:hypothetical protein